MSNNSIYIFYFVTNLTVFFYMTGFALNMSGFVLNMTKLLLFMYVFVTNMTVFVLNVTVFVLNIPGFVLNMNGCILNITECYIRHKDFRLPPPSFGLCDAQGTPPDSKTGWTGELWSKTNRLNWQNYQNSIQGRKKERKFIPTQRCWQYRAKHAGRQVSNL